MLEKNGFLGAEKQVGKLWEISIVRIVGIVLFSGCCKRNIHVALGRRVEYVSACLGNCIQFYRYQFRPSSPYKKAYFSC